MEEQQFGRFVYKMYSKYLFEICHFSIQFLFLPSLTLEVPFEGIISSVRNFVDRLAKSKRVYLIRNVVVHMSTQSLKISFKTSYNEEFQNLYLRAEVKLSSKKRGQLSISNS